MRQVKIGKHKVELYDSIDELPIVRFHKFNKYVLVDCGIGSDMSDVDTHFEKILRYSAKKDFENLQKEIQNLRENLYFVLTELNPKTRSFCCLVKSIDGKDVGNSDSGIESVFGILSGIPKKEMDGELEGLKKKLTSELDSYFPNLFDNSKTKEYYDLLKKRASALLRSVVSPDPGANKQSIEEIDTKLLTFSAPKIFSGKDGIEVNYDRNFENICVYLSGRFNVKPKEMTTLEFYNAYELFQQNK